MAHAAIAYKGWRAEADGGGVLLIATSLAHADEANSVPPAEGGDAAAARLEAIGGLSAINARHTFLLIGTVADAHIKGIYEPKQVRSIMNGVVRQLETLDGMLRKRQRDGLGKEDNEYVERVLAMHLKLQAQARALNGFVEKKGESEARTFEKSRQASLRELERLLGVEADAPSVSSENENPMKEISGASSSEKAKQE